MAQLAKVEARLETRAPRWVTAVVILGALLMVVGELLAVLRPAQLLAPGEVVTGAVRVYAGYLFSRNLALGVLLVVMLRLRARGALRGLMVLYASVQFLDAIMDAVEGRWAILPVVVVLGVLFAVGTARLPREATVW
jgi:hypothetical protein